MLNPAHILETALLMLVAFLIGATAGYLARRLVSPKPKAEAKPAVVEAPAASTEPPLVVAPTIAPLARTTPRRTPAERLAAAAGRDPGPALAVPPAPPEPSPSEPANAAPAAATPGGERTAAPAGETTAPATESPAAATADAAPQGPSDAAPPAPEAEPAVTPVAGEEPAPPPAEPAPSPAASEPPPLAPDEPKPLPPPVPELAAIELVMPAPEAPAAEPWSSDAPQPDEAAARAEPGPGDEPEPAVEAAPAPAPEPAAATLGDVARAGEEDDDPEAAARRAIEGSWSPRRSTAKPTRPVQHPEPAEVETAIASARTAVASAAAAAAAAVGDRSELDFEVATETSPKPFLETEGAAEPHIETSGLSFGGATHQVFGRPESLPGARDGQADNLKLIKGITPQLESALHGLGIFHFDQIAAWDQKALVWIDTHLGLKGRITREKWLEQARDLAGGKARPARPVRR